MKKEIFKISKLRMEFLNWSFGIGIALMLLKFFENFGNKISDASDVISGEGSSVAGESVLMVLLGVGITLCCLLMWEQLRHALLKANCYWLQLTQIVVMVLTAFLAAVSVFINFDLIGKGGVQAIGGLHLFHYRLSFLTAVVVSVANILLGLGLVKCFKGVVCRYGVALLLIPLLDVALGWFYNYLYTSVGGLTFQTLETYRIMMVAGQFLLQVSLLAFLRFSFTTDDLEMNNDVVVKGSENSLNL